MNRNRKKISVHLLQPFDQDWIDRFKEKLHPDIKMIHGKVSVPATYEILIAGRPKREHLTASPRLQMIIIPWAGLPESTGELLQEFPEIAVHNIHHNAAPAAEMAIALMMATMKRILPIDHSFREHDWTLRYQKERSPLLEGKSVLILGYGSIGKRIAKTCNGLGMTINAIKRNPPYDNDEFAKLFSPQQLQKLLEEAGVLFICLPLTSETKDLIGAGELEHLPDGATIINVARGAIINEEALYQKLHAGRLKFGSDVWYDYPEKKEARSNTAPSKFPFHELDNIVMTPHLGGLTDDTEGLSIHHLAELLNLVAEGNSLPNKVDIYRGY